VVLLLVPPSSEPEVAVARIAKIPMMPMVAAIRAFRFIAACS
jgi:hypothetical protein